MTDNELETFSVEALNKSSNNFIVTEISSSSLRCKRKLIQKRSIDCFLKKRCEIFLIARGTSKSLATVHICSCY